MGDLPLDSLEQDRVEGEHVRGSQPSLELAVAVCGRQEMILCRAPLFGELHHVADAHRGCAEDLASVLAIVVERLVDQSNQRYRGDRCCDPGVVRPALG